MNTTTKTPRALTYAKLVAKHQALEAKLKDARKFAKLLAKSDALAAQIAATRSTELVTNVWPKITSILVEYDVSKMELLEYAKEVSITLRSRGAPAIKGKVRKPSKAVAYKYAIGTTMWSGRGIMPTAFREALAADPTKTKADFLIKH